MRRRVVLFLFFFFLFFLVIGRLLPIAARLRWSLLALCEKLLGLITARRGCQLIRL
jgi:hypothetical protein